MSFYFFRDFHTKDKTQLFMLFKFIYLVDILIIRSSIFHKITYI